MATATLENDIETGAGLAIESFRFDATIHNGFITIHNTNTDGHRTFRIETIKEGPLEGKRIVSLLTGPDRDDDTNWYGFAFADEFGIRLWRRIRESRNGATYTKFARMLEMPSKYESLGCRYLIAGRCRRCNRPLTSPASVDTGLGPVCRNK